MTALMPFGADPDKNPDFVNPQGLIEPGNIDLYHRPKLKNADGSVSTVRSMSFSDDKGNEILVPTVGPKGEDWTPDQAVEAYRKTGKHLGKFKSPQAADRYAQLLHLQQEKLYAK